jgi:glutathione S-transferase
LAPHIVLEWLGAHYEAVRIEKGDPEYLKINPLGVVAAIDDKGKL